MQLAPTQDPAPRARCAGRGTGSATGGSRACVWVKTLPLRPPSLHRDTHGAAPVTGGSQGVPREALPRQGTAEALLPGRTWHRLNRHLHLDGDTFPADRRWCQGGSPRGTPPVPARHGGSRGGRLEGMCFSPSALSTATLLTCPRCRGPRSACSLQGPRCWQTGCPALATLALGVDCGCCWGGRQRGLELHPQLLWGWAALPTAHSLGTERTVPMDCSLLEPAGHRACRLCGTHV